MVRKKQAIVLPSSDNILFDSAGRFDKSVLLKLLAEASERNIHPSRNIRVCAMSRSAESVSQGGSGTSGTYCDKYRHYDLQDIYKNNLPGTSGNYSKESENARLDWEKRAVDIKKKTSDIVTEAQFLQGAAMKRDRSKM